MGKRGDVARLRISILVGFSILLVLIAGARFARTDVAGTGVLATDDYYTWTSDDGRFVDHLNIDIAQYLSMVEDYRGVEGAFEKQEPYPAFEATGESVRGPVDPFTSRVALPWLASLLPMDATYAFATVNLVLLLLGLWLLVDALAVAGRSPLAQGVGAALYTFALPVLMFSTALFIDGGVVGALVIGYWLMVRRWWWGLVVFFPVSYLVKEALLILAPAAIWAWRVHGGSYRDPRFITGAAISAAGVVGASVWASAMAPEAVYSFTVLPTWQFIRWNLTNPTSAVFFAVGMSTVVVPALLGIRLLVRPDGWRRALEGPAGPDIVGFAAVAAMNAYSIVSTDLTLRTGWLIWPFAIGLAALWVDSSEKVGEFVASRTGGRLSPAGSPSGSTPQPR